MLLQMYFSMEEDKDQLGCEIVYEYKGFCALVADILTIPIIALVAK